MKLDNDFKCLAQSLACDECSINDSQIITFALHNFKNNVFFLFTMNGLISNNVIFTIVCILLKFLY